MNGSKEEEILQELRRISKLLVLTATKDQTQKDKIVLLSRIGFEPKDIANLIGTTPGTVSVTLSVIKKGVRGEKGETGRSPRQSKSSDK
jgi:hypothetical protein